ncbi:hypothetical protein [Pseudobacteroides cellulosolvens]|uniref:Nucleotidyltransferase n=1 Tax=Pseudobacteroides cellulosolvens ATCC 35603 = DSM 2933 TaxID=398512 RepID=A0A0L6JWI8_9FIRM|nr:hypothetical protein [Pseudobacteroides cellulosolvens]KNY30114.1 hypothetical protein Bccel_5391 [Pseudobacteroides cellulosolvens ATCC 35603 = DSM 2933]
MTAAAKEAIENAKARGIIDPDELSRIGSAAADAVASWQKIVSQVNNIMSPYVANIKRLSPDAKVGYRGSLATGIKHSTQGPFDPTDFDVDAFIVSDSLAARFDSNVFFRDARNLPEFKLIADDLEEAFINSLSGYRTELGKPFTFRIWTEAEYLSKVVPYGYKLLE